VQRIPSDDDEIVRLYVQEGLRGPVIAKRLDVTDALVYERLDKAGVRRSRRADLPPEAIVRLYCEERRPLTRIAQKFGVVPATVRRHLQLEGVRVRSFIESKQPSGRHE
jgi:hypothetical protein